MRFPLKGICTTHFIRDADGNRHLPRGAKRSESTIVITPTVPKPIPVNIKPNARHKEQIRQDHLTGSRLMNPMRTDPHGHLRRPDMKLERLIARGNHRQSSAPRIILA